jgi:hypothetical protein
MSPIGLDDRIGLRHLVSMGTGYPMMAIGPTTLRPPALPDLGSERIAHLPIATAHQYADRDKTMKDSRHGTPIAAEFTGDRFDRKTSHPELGNPGMMRRSYGRGTAGAIHVASRMHINP